MRMQPENNKEKRYQDIIESCEQLPIARYLKNEVKNSLQYFHAYKLENIHKNLDAFTEYLLFVNEENCKKIQALEIDPNNKKTLNNNLAYFYDHEDLSTAQQEEITLKIECNSYQVITLMQGLKGLLLLTIDEFCNASPTRMAINTFMRKNNSTKKEKKH